MVSRHSALAAVALVLAGAIGWSASAETVTIQMTTVDFQPRFVPEELTIEPGDTVRWVNVDPFLLDHSTVSGTGSADPLAGRVWDSGILRSSDFFEVTFPDAGDFEYFSRPHEYEGMFGVIHVTTGLPVPEIEISTWGKIKVKFDDILPKD